MTLRRVTRRKPLEAGLASPGPLFQWMENEKSKFELEVENRATVNVVVNEVEGDTKSVKLAKCSTSVGSIEV